MKHFFILLTMLLMCNATLAENSHDIYETLTPKKVINSEDLTLSSEDLALPSVVHRSNDNEKEERIIYYIWIMISLCILLFFLAIICVYLTQKPKKDKKYNQHFNLFCTIKIQKIEDNKGYER